MSIDRHCDIYHISGRLSRRSYRYRIVGKGWFLERLLEAEGAVGKMNPLAVQALLRDAEDIAIGIQRQFIELLEENERMRRQQRTHVRKSVHPLSDPRWEIEAADPLTIN
jgi:hypothetical protein